MILLGMVFLYGLRYINEFGGRNSLVELAYAVDRNGPHYAVWGSLVQKKKKMFWSRHNQTLYKFFFEYFTKFDTLSNNITLSILVK